MMQGARTMGVHKKRRHHHVVRSYLDAWIIDGKIQCLGDRGIFSTNTINVALETDFYRLQHLTDGDRAFIGAMIRALPQHAHQVAFNYLKMFTLPFLFREQLRRLGRLTPDAEAEIDLMIQNTEEDYHEQVERPALKILVELRNGDRAALEDNQYFAFSYFMAKQYFRTKAMRERMRAEMPSGRSYDFNRCWTVLAHVYSATIGSTIFSSRTINPVRVLKNETNVEFITGDQPIINLHASIDEEKKHFSIYYPISPRLAVFIDDSSRPLEIDKNALDEGEVIKLNDEIKKNSYKQIFASKPAMLERYAGTC